MAVGGEAGTLQPAPTYAAGTGLGITALQGGEDVNFWEISLKFSLGKLTLEGVTPDELPDYAERAGLHIRETSTGLFATFHRLPQIGHRDPFDRLLIHCAIQEHLTLLSADSAFADYRPYGLKLIDD